MPKHDDHYIPEYCNSSQVICVNCGSIFQWEQRVYHRPQGQRNHVPKTRQEALDAIEKESERIRNSLNLFRSAPISAHPGSKESRIARANEECYPPPPVKKLKPGVKPW